MKTIKFGADKRNNRLALCIYKGAPSVWIEKENYNLGRMVKSWCHIKKGITMEEAEAIFKRRSA